MTVLVALSFSFPLTVTVMLPSPAVLPVMVHLLSVGTMEKTALPLDFVQDMLVTEAPSGSMVGVMSTCPLVDTLIVLGSETLVGVTNLHVMSIFL